MSYLLEILGRGLLRELAEAFGDLLRDDGLTASRELEQNVAAHPDRFDPQQKLGLRLLQDAQFARARAAFTAALELEPGDFLSQLGLACTLDALGLIRPAIEQLQACLDHHPGNPAVLLAMGYCQEKQGDPGEAIQCYEQALRSQTSLHRARQRLAAIHLRLDDTVRAIEQYEHLCFAFPDDAAANLILANLYAREERHDDAIRRYQLAILMEPENWDVHDDLVSVYAAAGQWDQAIQTLLGLIQGQPDCADHHLRLGDLFSRAGRGVLAVAEYARAAQLNPDCLEAAIKLGTAHLRRNEIQPAIESFSRAIEINDRTVSAYLGITACAHAEQRDDDAQAHLDMAAAIEPNSTLLFAELCRLQLKLSAARQVNRYLAPQAVAAQPSGPVNRQVENMVEQQIEHLQAAIRRHPTHADLHYRLGLLQRHQGRLTDAIQSFSAAVGINPQYSKALNRLAVALHETGQLGAAMEAARRALVLEPETASLHYQLGLLHADRREFSAAVSRFEQALGGDLGSADSTPEREAIGIDALAHIALALENMGLIDRAEATWRCLAGIAEDAPSSHPLLRELSPAS